MWHSSDSVPLVELIFYIPLALLSIFVCIQHGFHRSSGWIYALILCTVRIIGSICHFVSDNNPSVSLLRTVVILDSVGLSPLLLATLGLLSRYVDFVNAKSAPTFTTRHFRLIQLVLLVGMILAIVGGTNTTVSANGSYQIPTSSKIGVILYVVGFIGITLMFLMSAPRASIIPDKERRIPLAIALALPFILVRLVYSVLSVFLHSHLFSVATGSVPVRVCMAVIEELIVVAVYVLLGFYVDKMDAASTGSIASRPWSKKRVNPNKGLANRERMDIEAQYLNSHGANSSPSRFQTSRTVE
ncbi:hypothetical protein N0V94_002883 [Neodidymelliopsis sp. IMI 364377]|nr:hypothetical protein N0V94_002883 [Neodidymelliopsis sp. IMI 364377]